jgi:hypothetical protein
MAQDHIKDYKDRELVRKARARMVRLLRGRQKWIPKPKSYTIKEIQQLARSLRQEQSLHEAQAAYRRIEKEAKARKALQSTAEKSSIVDNVQAGKSSIVDNVQEVLDALDLKPSSVLRRLPHTAGLAVALTPSPASAGEDELLYKMRRKKVPGGGPDDAHFKRQKKGGSKVKKNYSRGGGVRAANY